MDAVLIVLAMLAAAALYFSQLATASLWTDEGVTARVVTEAPGRFLRHLVFAEPSSAAYYLVLRPWVALFGTSEVGLRSLSATAAVGTVPFVYLSGLRIGGRTIAVGGSALIVVNSFVLDFATEARAYALTMMLVAASTWLLLRAAETGTRGRWAAYAVALTAAIHLHFYAVFVALAQGMWVWLRESSIRSRGVQAVALSLLASVPIALLIVIWGPVRAWLHTPTPLSILRILVNVAGATIRGWGSLVGIAYLAGVIALAWVAWRSRHRLVGHRLEALLLVLSVCLPVVVGLVVSLVKPIFIARSLIVIVPALSLALAMAVSQVRRPALIVVILGLVLVLSMNELLGATNRKADWRGAVASLAPRANTGDAVLIYPAKLRWLTVRYYVTRTPRIAALPILNETEDERDALPGLIRQGSSRYDRIWLLITDGTLRRPPGGLTLVVRELKRFYRVEDKARFHRVQLVLFD